MIWLIVWAFIGLFVAVGLTMVCNQAPKVEAAFCSLEDTWGELVVVFFLGPVAWWLYIAYQFTELRDARAKLKEAGRE